MGCPIFMMPFISSQWLQLEYKKTHRASARSARWCKTLTLGTFFYLHSLCEGGQCQSTKKGSDFKSQKVAFMCPYPIIKGQIKQFIWPQALKQEATGHFMVFKQTQRQIASSEFNPTFAYNTHFPVEFIDHNVECHICIFCHCLVMVCLCN